MRIVGVVLAAGAGRRMGTPKALLRHPDGVGFAAAAAAALRAAGCAEVLVSVGAQAERVRATLPAGVHVVEVPDWTAGQGAGLLRCLELPRVSDADAVLVTLVDLPHVTVAGVRAVLALASPTALVRAVEDGRPGHPVLVGRGHLARAVEVARSGAGLKELFAGPATLRVEVPGAVTDVDRPADLPPGTLLP